MRRGRFARLHGGTSISRLVLVATSVSAINAPTFVLQPAKVCSALVRLAVPVRMDTTEYYGSPGAWRTVVDNARERAATVKEGHDETAAAMAVSALAVYALPLFDGGLFDVLFSTLFGVCIGGYMAGFDRSVAGDIARKVGGTVSWTTGTVGSKIGELEFVQSIMAKGKDISYADVKKYGVAGTIAYILTELAFWAIAFPVASTSFFNLNGHWPDFGDGGDRAAVLGFIFGAANVARLVVPVRFGVAISIIPWVDENIVAKFGLGKEDE